MQLGEWDSVTEIPSQLFPCEHIFLRDFAKRVSGEFDNPTILNVGVWRGASCYVMKVGAPKSRLVAVDVMGVYSVDTPGLLEYLNMEIIKRNSNYVDWKDSIHLLFIDGGHEYDVVCQDICIYCKHIVPGGYVIFHDSKRDEVVDAINDLLRSPSWFTTAMKWEELKDVVATLAVFRRTE